MAKKSPAELLAERTKRLQDAHALRVPDRIPIVMFFGYMLARLGGITNQELERNYQKQQELLEKWALYYEPDQCSSGILQSPFPSITLGDRMSKFPGYGLSENGIYQFVEGEYMKAEEYDEFIEDPGTYVVTKLLPRTYAALEPFSKIPRLTSLLGPGGVMGGTVLTIPEVASALETYKKAGREAMEFSQWMNESARRMEALGFPNFAFLGALAQAPFDVISDFMRGMRGAMLDMFRCPDKLLKALEKITSLQIKQAVEMGKATGARYCFIALHRGSDGFMSIDQFETFYWPQLKAVMLGIIDAGMIPTVFYEGVWDQRLHYLTELPRGKTVGMFQSSNMEKVKEVVGDVMCIQGGMPVSLLQTGTPDEVREYTKKVCKVLGKNGGFVMGSSVVLNEADPKLVKVWADATREFGVY